jgi:hypothetical protein
MKFTKLMDNKGRRLKKTQAVDGSINWEPDGKAYAWAADGKTCLAELHGSRVVWIGAAGIRLEGMEPIDLMGTRYRAQSWHLSF